MKINKKHYNKGILKVATKRTRTSELNKKITESLSKQLQDGLISYHEYVQSLINDIRKHKFTKIAPEDGHCCNGLWKKYA